MNCLKNVVIWYEDHRHRCPYEPHLAELDPTFGLYTTAVRERDKQTHTEWGA